MKERKDRPDFRIDSVTAETCGGERPAIFAIASTRTQRSVSRRHFCKACGSLVVALGLGSLSAGCGGSSSDECVCEGDVYYCACVADPMCGCDADPGCTCVGDPGCGCVADRFSPPGCGCVGDVPCGCDGNVPCGCLAYNPNPCGCVAYNPCGCMAT